MSAKILDGKRIAEELRLGIAREAAELTASIGVAPRLAAVLVGNDPASQVYVRNKTLACQKAGLEGVVHRLDASCGLDALLGLVRALNADPRVHGILVQFPLPQGFDGDDERAVVDAIDPMKDVDCLHPKNVGWMCEGRPRFLPCTPGGIQAMLLHEGIEIAGARVVIVGRSALVGRPLANMLSQKGRGGDATVTLCHSRSRDLPSLTKAADILVVAIGRPEFIKGDAIRPGAVVVDVGIHRTPDGKLVGDVDFASARAVASAITPVPGGVGPMTITTLLANTVRAARGLHFA